jgi:hypothetical protein
VSIIRQFAKFNTRHELILHAQNNSAKKKIAVSVKGWAGPPPLDRVG